MKRNKLQRALLVLLVGLVIIAIGIVFTQKIVLSDNNIDVNKQNIYSRNAILIDAQSKKELYSKSSNKLIYPASMTKIMSAIIMLENNNLDQKITIPAEAFENVYQSNASLAGFSVGDYLTKKDLLYGAMLPSGAEATKALAIATAGSESEFVKLMNKKVVELGLKNTYFTNCTGLPDDKQVTTVSDISKIFSYALKNKKFKKIISTSRYRTNPTNQYSNGLVLKSTLFSKYRKNKRSNIEIVGGKTGYTEEAGQCLASYARVKGKYYIFVSAGASVKSNREHKHINDALTIYQSINKDEIN